MRIHLLVLVLVTMVGCTGPQRVTSVVPEPTDVPPRCPRLLEPSDATPRGAALHVQHAGHMHGGALDSSGEYLVLEDYGSVVVVRLSDGRELHHEEVGLDEWRWSFEPGRLHVLREDPGSGETLVAEIDVETGRATLVRRLRASDPVQLGPELLIASDPSEACAGGGVWRWSSFEGRAGQWCIAGGRGRFKWAASGELAVFEPWPDYASPDESAPDSLVIRDRDPIVLERELNRVVALGRRTLVWSGGQGVLVQTIDMDAATIPAPSELLPLDGHPSRVMLDPRERALALTTGMTLHVIPLDAEIPALVRELEFEAAAGAFVDAECGLVLLDDDGRRHWIPTREAGGEARSMGLRRPGRSLQLLGGSLTGSLELGAEYAGSAGHYDWSPTGTSFTPTVAAPRRAGRTLVVPESEGVRVFGNELGEELLTWPEPHGDPEASETPAHTLALSPDGRWLALLSWFRFHLTMFVPTPVPPTGKLVVYDLAHDRVAWSLDAVDPRVTALAWQDERLWLVRHPHEREPLRVEQRRLSDGKRVRTWKPTGLEGATIVALAIHGEATRGDATVYGLIESPSYCSSLAAWRGDRLLWRMGLDSRCGDDNPHADFHRSFGAAAWERDLEAKRLALSHDGQHLILDGTSLWQLTEAGPLELSLGAGVIRPMIWAEQSGGLLVLESEGRVSAWRLGDPRALWTVQLYGEGEWVWWDDAGLRGRSPGSDLALVWR